MNIYYTVRKMALFSVIGIECFFKGNVVSSVVSL